MEVALLVRPMPSPSSHVLSVLGEPAKQSHLAQYNQGHTVRLDSRKAPSGAFRIRGTGSVPHSSSWAASGGLPALEALGLAGEGVFLASSSAAASSFFLRANV